MSAGTRELHAIRARAAATSAAVCRAVDAGDLAAFEVALAGHEATFDALGRLMAEFLPMAGALDAAARASAIDAAIGIREEHAGIGRIVSAARQRAALAVADSRRVTVDGYDAAVPGVAFDRRG